MKKFFKVFTSLLTLSALGFGVYCLYKKLTDSDPFEDEDFDDLFEDDEDVSSRDREYVSIHLANNEKEEKTEE